MFFHNSTVSETEQKIEHYLNKKKKNIYINILIKKLWSEVMFFKVISP